MGLEREESCPEEGKEAGPGAKWGEATCDSSLMADWLLMAKRSVTAKIKMCKAFGGKCHIFMTLVEARISLTRFSKCRGKNG